MPTWRNNAWTEIIPCYGMTTPLESGQPGKGDRSLGDRAINDLVAFIFRDIAGQETVTREYCDLVSPPGSTRCSSYPTAAEVAAAEPEGEPAP